MLLVASVSQHVKEDHKSHRAGWLRAAVLGANDGIVSTASLVIGVAAATSSRSPVFTAGIAGLVGGAMSMAAGEYISVSSQRDAEEADVRIEAEALAEDRQAELRELAKIYENRGVEPGLARLVADQLMAHDELGAHMRDELGITEVAIAAVAGRLDVGGGVHDRSGAPVRRRHARADQRPDRGDGVGRAGRARGARRGLGRRGRRAVDARCAWSPGRRWQWR